MVTLEELRKKHQEIIENSKGGNKQQDGGGDFARFHDGKNVVRILPGKKDQLDFFAESAIHRITGPDGKIFNYNCRRIQNEACPVCDYYFDLWKQHKELNLPKDKDGKQQKSKYGNLATKIKQKPRYFVTAVVRELQEKGEDCVKYIAMSQELFDRVMAAVTNPDLTDDSDPDNTTMLSLERGNDFVVVITKKGEYNSFVESEPKIKKTRAGTPIEIAAWTETKLDPKSLIKIGDYEEGKKIVGNLRASLDSITPENVGPKKSSPTTQDNDDKFNKEMEV